MFLRHLGDGQNILLRQHRAGGVAGGVQQERPGVGGDGLLNIRRLHPVVIFFISRNGNRPGAHNTGLAVVVGETGIRHQDLIAGVQQQHHGQHQALHGAHGDDDMILGVALPVPFPVLVGHSLPQLRNAGVGGVVGLTLVNGFLGSLLDVLRCVEVGLAHRQLDGLRILSRQIKHLPNARCRIVFRPIGHVQLLFHYCPLLYIYVPLGIPSLQESTSNPGDGIRLCLCCSPTAPESH